MCNALNECVMSLHGYQYSLLTGSLGLIVHKVSLLYIAKQILKLKLEQN